MALTDLARSPHLRRRMRGVLPLDLALAMDEAERVSIRGTSPNLNLVTINGHSLSSGDWHVGDQSAASGRSVSRTWTKPGKFSGLAYRLMSARFCSLTSAIDDTG